MNDYIVEKHVNGKWEETYMKHLKVKDVFRICHYLNHLNEYVPCTNGCACSEWIVAGEQYKHPVYGLWVTPVEPTLSRSNPIKFIGGGHMVKEI